MNKLDFYEEQELPPPLFIFDLAPEACEYVGEHSHEEIMVLLQEGVSLSLDVEDAQQEYCIEGRGNKVIFEVWHLEGDHISSALYDDLDTLLQIEASRPSFDLGKFELIS